ncbi:hypothetical protein Bca101_046470 [Brassica carinata]
MLYYLQLIAFVLPSSSITDLLQSSKVLQLTMTYHIYILLSHRQVDQHGYNTQAYRKERNRMEALQNLIDNQNKEELDAASAETEKECLKHAAATDTGNLEVLTYHHWFWEIVGFFGKTKEHRD